MRRKRSLCHELAAVLVLLAGCYGEIPTPVPPDGAVDTGADVKPQDSATPDVVAPDVVAPDVVAPDVVTPDVVTPDVVTRDGGCGELATCDAAVPDAGPVARTTLRPGRFSTLSVRAWQAGSVRVVDDELEASEALCSGSGSARVCITGGFLQ
jgi:hypothetical protein